MTRTQPDWLTQTCRRIETAETEPTLEDLARDVGMSTAHFQKTFKAALGLSPHQYAAALRRERVQAALSEGGGVTGAIFEAGFQSGSRFYEKSDALLGMKPGTYARGGVGEVIEWGVGRTTLGQVLAARTAKGLCAIFMDDTQDALLQALQARFPKAQLRPAGEDFATLLSAVIRLIEQPGAAPDLPLDIRGTVFQQRVWDALRAIPAGQTRSYAEVAQAIGSPESVRAVAGACAANKLAVVIPCHRVVRTDGALSGYRWGVERKRALLKREQD